MGTNCAPVLANLFLYCHESRFVDRLVASDVARARLFHLTFRYIDDTLSIDNPAWCDAVKAGLYPRSLTLNDTTPKDGGRDTVQFLGMNIESRRAPAPARPDRRPGANANRFRLSVYDKRKAFPFRVHRYPQISSLMPPTIPYGVFVGQLHRGYRICSDVQAFLEYVVDVWQRCVRNGYSEPRLMRRFTRFASQHVAKFHGYNTARLTRQLRRILAAP